MYSGVGDRVMAYRTRSAASVASLDNETTPVTVSRRKKTMDALDKTVESGTDAFAVLPEIEHGFRTDPAETYQNRVRPLTAPELPPLAIEQYRAGQRLAIYSYTSLLKQDWYDFMIRVQGLCRRPDSEFISIQSVPRHDGADIIGGDVYGRRVPYQAQQTPYADRMGPSAPTPGGPAPVPTPDLMGSPTPGGPAPVAVPTASELFPDNTGSPYGDASESEMARQASGVVRERALSNRQLVESAAELIMRRLPAATTMVSGERLTEFQARIDALHDETRARQGNDAEASELRRDLRKAFAGASWLDDPLRATGFAVFSPIYIAAKDQALALIHQYCRDTSLGDVPESEFIRRRPARIMLDGREDTHWQTVRSMFARLVATMLNRQRMEAGTGTRYASDLPSITADFNRQLTEFRNIVGYDRDAQTFYIIDPRNDERRQPIYERYSELRHTPREHVRDGGARARRDAITYQMFAQ